MTLLPATNNCIVIIMCVYYVCIIASLVMTSPCVLASQPAMTSQYMTKPAGNVLLLRRSSVYCVLLYLLFIDDIMPHLLLLYPPDI